VLNSLVQSFTIAAETLVIMQLPEWIREHAQRFIGTYAATEFTITASKCSASVRKACFNFNPLDLSSSQFYMPHNAAKIVTVKVHKGAGLSYNNHATGCVFSQRQGVSPVKRNQAVMLYDKVFALLNSV